jgi:hypothetical protein
MEGQLAIRGRGSPRVGVSALGVAGALIVHGLLALPFVLDLSLPARRVPDRNGAGASALFSLAEPEMTVVFVNELAPVSALPPPKLDALASRGLESPGLPVVVLSPDDSPAQPAAQVAADHQETPETSPSVPDLAQHALLYGRYLGQLQARIERAWLRPRTEIGASQFSCRARIRQDRQGVVVDVKFDHCNGTQRWQQSLLSAIRTASPLPAPPDPSVYADVLWLNFVSRAFEEEGSAQDFEPENWPANNTHASVLASFQEFARGPRYGLRSDVKETSEVFHLTIIGSPASRSEANQVRTELQPTAESPERSNPKSE